MLDKTIEISCVRFGSRNSRTRFHTRHCNAGMQDIGRLEDAGQGLTTNTFNQTDSPSGYTFANALAMLVFDSIYWSIVAWYLNRVVASAYGVPLKWYFPFTPSYWCPGTATAPPFDEDMDEDGESGIPIEPVSNTLKQQAEEGTSIEIRGLHKQYGEKIAVDGLSLSMYKGQVTALLGHNGAGSKCSFPYISVLWHHIIQVLILSFSCTPYRNNYDQHADWNDEMRQWFRHCRRQRHSNTDAADPTRSWNLSPARLPLPISHREGTHSILRSSQRAVRKNVPC